MRTIQWCLKVALALTCNVGSALAQGLAQADQDRWCTGLEMRRAQAVQQRDLGSVEKTASDYVAQCRMVRSKVEISRAMAEVAGSRRAVGQKQEGLAQAQECIKFEYLGLACHLEKAMALNELGMKSEAREVLRTAGEVATKLMEAGNHQLMRIEQSKGRLKSEDVQRLTREARARIAMSGEGEKWLRQAQEWIGAQK